MPLEVFKELAPAFRRTNLVYLQGWGEPLLHPQFFEMLRIAKVCGAQVGTTTNGMLCDAKTAERMVMGGLDIVGFSLAGTDESQDKVRRLTRIRNVLQAIRRIDDIKKSCGAYTPEVHVAYIWLRSQINALKGLPALLEGTGVSQVVVTTLDFVPHPDLATETLHARDQDEEMFLRRMISEVGEEGKERGLEIFFRLVERYKQPRACTENVTKSLFISSLGFVSPCVFRNLPIVQGSGSGALEGAVPPTLRYGNINDRSLPQIWRERSYRAFRRDHTKGRATRYCGDCPKLFCSTYAFRLPATCSPQNWGFAWFGKGTPTA